MITMRKIFLTFATVAISAILFVRCGTTNDPTPTPQAANLVSNYSASFLTEWFKLECRVVKNTAGFFPPQAARAFGYTGIAAYESVYSGITGAKPLAGQLNQLSTGVMPMPDPQSYRYHWGIVANAAVAEMMRSMFEKSAISTTDLAAINKMESDNYENMSKGITIALAEVSAKHGKAVAQALFNYSKSDGAHESYLNPFNTPYTPVTGADKWISTNPKFLTPLAPTWHKCRYMIQSDSIFANPPKPITFSIETTSEFYKQANQVYTQVTNNSSEQVEIAKFWADDPFATCTPTGHTFNILTQLLQETNATLEKASVAYAKMGIGEIDAFIACWKTKYQYSLIRPISYIQKYIDPKFTTVIGTPPFPAYTSGHATEGAVGARIFTKLFTNGDGYYPFTDRSQLQHGFSVRNFRNFEELANECSMSRLYGGIHYDMDNQKGLQMGRGIGDNVNTAIQWPSGIK
jgi:hypothetical protein